jgi:hypothetical protein
LAIGMALVGALASLATPRARVEVPVEPPTPEEEYGAEIAAAGSAR